MDESQDAMLKTLEGLLLNLSQDFASLSEFVKTVIAAEEEPDLFDAENDDGM